MRRLKDEEGASAVEFAIVASLLLMILFGIIQFGIAYNRVQGLNSAGREGARTASIGAPIGDIVSRVRTAQSLFQQADVQVNIEYCPPSLDCTNGANWTTVCSTPGTACSQTGGNSASRPCTGACVVGSLIRVTGRVPPPGANMNRYAIAIPLWASVRPTWTGSGTFRMEKTS